MIAVPSFFAEYQSLVDADLARMLDPGSGVRGPGPGTRKSQAASPRPGAQSPGDRVSRSMAYTVLAPSKRVRPVLTLLSAQLCGGPPARAIPAAAAIELVHAASLILDDLPSMDDAPLRRGRKANHLEFGESIAILAAFALLNLAYGTLARAYDAPLSARLSSLLADAVGTDGLIAGQAADLLATDQQVTFDGLERIHRGKTGALFSAAATSGAILAGAPADAVASLASYAKNLGLAFQIVDDLLDVEGDPAETGKAIREDARKTTFVSFSGVAGARQLAVELCQTADRALTPFGRRADRLRELSAFVAGRSW
ncbi:MAG: polyprenyl synthetase family protein [Acidobacteriota bacterium]